MPLKFGMTQCRVNFIIGIVLLAPMSFADVVRDGTIGPDASIQPTGPNFEITENFGEQHGNNLFHSFQEFDLSQDQSATFSGSNTIDNIIGRVTGSSASNIDGLLRSAIPGADLYLMNPYGIVFGPNAQLDVQGVFHASTAGELLFSNGEILNAELTAPTILSLAPPEAFGFLGEAAAPITLNGAILSTVHGIDFSAGTVALNDGAMVTVVTDESSGISPDNEIQIQASDQVVLSGTRVGGEGAKLETVALSGTGNGGSIVVEAPTITLQDGAIISSLTTGDGDGGDIVVIAGERLTLSGTNDYDLHGASLQSETLGGGNSGAIIAEAPVIELQDGAYLFSATFGGGAGGELSVTASEQLAVSGLDGNGEAGWVFAGTQIGDGDGGDVAVRAPAITLSDGANIQAFTQGSGNGGNLSVIAEEQLTLSGAAGHGQPTSLATLAVAGGNAGDLRVEADVITLEDAAAIVANTVGTGAAGNIDIVAAEHLTLSGTRFDGFGASIETATLGAGNAGALRIEAPEITFLDGARLVTGTAGSGAGGDLFVTASERLTLSGATGLGESAFFLTAAIANGEAGDLHVEAPVITLQDGATILASTFGPGTGGDVIVTATEHLTLSGIAQDGSGAFIEAGSIGSGAAGTIQVQAPVIELQDGAHMSIQTEGSGPGGQLLVAAAERLELSGTNGNGEGARLIASSFGSETGGDILVEAPTISLTDSAAIKSESTSTGNAGSITVIANDALHLTNRSAISTQADAASGGDISIQVDRLINLRDSEITTSVTSGTGQGGNIFIDPDLVVMNSSLITAQADTGHGGNIQIIADQLLISSDSIIDASAGPAGVDGNVVVKAPESDLTGELARPTPTFLNASALLQPGCEHRAQGTPGSLVVARQRGLPLSPEHLLLAYDEPAAITLEPAPLEVSMSNAKMTSRGTTLRGIALKQQADGHYGASLNTLSDIHTEQPHDIAATLGSAANAYLALDMADTALTHFMEAIDTAAEDDHNLLATLYNNLGNLHMVHQDFDAAANAYHTSAQQARLASDITQEAKALSNGARATLAADQLDRANALQQQSRKLAETMAAGHDKTYILIHQAKTAQSLSAAMANNAQQHLTTAYNDLRDAAIISRRLGNDRTLSYALGNLGSLYQQRHRLEEALYLTRLAQQAAERANAPEANYRWHWQVGQLLWTQGDPSGALQAYRQAVALLEASRPETLAQYGATQTHFRQAVAPVYLDFVDALLEHSSQADDPTALLQEARATVELLKAAELRNHFRDECITELEAKNTRLENVSPSAAIVYPIILPQRMELLVSLPGGDLQRHPVAVDATTLTQTTRLFRTLVETQSHTPQLHTTARQLYDWLVRPYIDTLKTVGIDTLVFVPDGPLHAAPLAALHNGDDYLIRRYGVVVAPGLSLTDPQPLNRDHPRLLLAGLSESVQNFTPLPYVNHELQRIQQLFGGRVLLDKHFTQPKMEHALETPTSIVHLASHAQFTGDTKNSFLLTHNGRLSMDQLGTMLEVTRFRNQPLELLVLSACQTAVGDHRAALGLAGIGLKAGARSAMGSLWFISDEGTSELMGDFYTKLKDPTLTKAQALQQAQQAMLDNERFAHPYYWSPFLLINNWL